MRPTSWIALTHVRRLHCPLYRREWIRCLLRNAELSVEDAQNEVRWIVDEVRSRQNGEGEASLTKTIEGLVRRRGAGEPLQYVLGSTEFGPLTLKCRPPTLIPRPETAEIFTRLAHLLKSSARPAAKPLAIADLCTGTGCIPLLLKYFLGTSMWTPVGIDISDEAIALAKENAASLGLQANFVQGDVFDIATPEKLIQLVGGKVDILLSNPPYIPFNEWQTLPPSVRQFEDHRALIGDPKGVAARGSSFYKRIADLLPDVLVTSEEQAAVGSLGYPKVMVEIGHQQAEEVRDIFMAVKGGIIGRTEIWKDQFGRDRAVLGWSPV